MTQTIGDVRKLIRKAKAIYVQPRFGLYEGWIKISKPEALKIFAAHSDYVTLFTAFDHDHELTIETNGDLCIS